MASILIADSGSTKTEWCLVNGKKKTHFITQGLSPYFVNEVQFISVLQNEVRKKLKSSEPDIIHFYGTGCSNPINVRLVRNAFKKVFPCKTIVEHDLLGAAKALCGHQKGIACILGTGSNSCYFNGRRIVKNSPGLGFILGDEGSGAYLGKKVIQYYLYNTFDPDLMDRFRLRFNTNSVEILEAVYKKPMPNRYLASFAIFLAENRGHFMIENIIEDGLNDFIFTHICKYSESWKLPVHFVGSIAFGFRDVLQDLCKGYELSLGTVIKAPMEGLIKYHSS